MNVLRYSRDNLCPQPSPGPYRWRGNKFRRAISSLFRYVDNKVIIEICADRKRCQTRAVARTVPLRTLKSPLAAEDGDHSFRQARCALDRRGPGVLEPENRTVIEREILIDRERASALYVVGWTK